MEDIKADLVKRCGNVINWKIQAEEWKRKNKKKEDIANKILGYVFLREQNYEWENKQKDQNVERDSILVTQEIFKHRKKVCMSKTTSKDEAVIKPVVFESSLNSLAGENIQDPFQFFHYTIPEELKNLFTKDKNNNNNKSNSWGIDWSQLQVKATYQEKKTNLSAEDKFRQIHSNIKKYKLSQTCQNRSTQTQLPQLKSLGTSNEINFKSPKRGKFLESSLECSQNLSPICDIDIAVDKRLFRSHKVLLMAFSRWFHRKLNAIPSGTKRIILNGIDSEAFGEVHNWIYTNQLSVNLENIASVLNVATKLEITTLIKKLKTVLLHYILSEGPIYIFKKAKKSNDDLLQAFAVESLISNLSILPQCDAFLHYDSDLILFLFSPQYCNGGKPTDVFSLLLVWLIHDWNIRQHDLDKVLQLVDYSKLTNDDVLECYDAIKVSVKPEICKKAILTSFTRCLDEQFQMSNNYIGKVRLQNSMLRNNIDVHDIRTPRPASCQSEHDDNEINSSSESECRYPVVNNKQISNIANGDNGLKSYFLVMGGIDPFIKTKNMDYGNCIFSYNINDDCWELLDYMPGPRHHGAADILHGCLYYTGGSNSYDGNNFEATNMVWCYDFFAERWFTKQNMIYSRVCHSVISIDGLLYAIGGMDKSNRLLNSIECYDPSCNIWTDIAFLEYPRMAMSTAEYRKMILICGGISEDISTTFSLVLKTCELFDPRSRTILKMKPLRIPRCFASLVQINDKLFLIGGATVKEGKKPSQTVSIKDIDEWDELSKVWINKDIKLQVERQDMVCGVAANCIYIIGGQSSQSKTTLPKVECYNYVESKWIDKISVLPVGLSGTSCVLLSSVHCLLTRDIKPFTA